ncbi:MAG: septal ring lytic transglycosylase RlpA family protein, partial [bacterium]|nr:septal ring lytic transglycosylase RlpA family protein [bacterium]
GLASYYGREFHGRKTANGETFDMEAMTAAHRTLPFGTMVRVTNLRTGQSVTVKINDRGPFVEGRMIDLSQGAARKIGIDGVEPVRLEIIQQPDN